MSHLTQARSLRVSILYVNYVLSIICYIKNDFLFLHCIVKSYSCSAYRLIIKNFFFAAFPSGWHIIFIVKNNTIVVFTWFICFSDMLIFLCPKKQHVYSLVILICTPQTTDIYFIILLHTNIIKCFLIKTDIESRKKYNIIIR